MADLTLSASKGMTPTAQLYLNATSVGSAISMAEIGTTGEFYADIPSGTAAGEYLVVFFNGATKLTSGVLSWDGTQEVAIPTASETAAAVLGANVEAGATLAQSLRLANAVLAGKVSGAQTGVETFRDLADTRDVIVSINDAAGNRTAVNKNLG